MSDLTRRIPWARLAIELAVIVGGILLALAIESWWESKADQALARDYLEALEAELDSDLERYRLSFLLRLDRKVEALAQIAPVVRRDAPVPADTVAFLQAVGLGGLAGIPGSSALAGTTTFDEMVATGSLSLIEDPELRAQLIAFYNRSASLEARFPNMMPNYPFFVHGYTPAELREEATPDDFRDFGLARAVVAFRSPEFQEIHGREYNYALYVRRQLMSVQEETRVIKLAVRCARGIEEDCVD